MESVRGSRTGVYIGVSLSDSSDAWTMETDGMVGYTMPGCCRAMFANRVSFFFDFKGKGRKSSFSWMLHSTFLSRKGLTCSLCFFFFFFFF